MSAESLSLQIQIDILLKSNGSPLETQTLGSKHMSYSVDVSNIFYFFLLGGGEGEALEAPRMGRTIFY